MIDLIYPERDLRGNLKGPGHPDYYHDHKKVAAIVMGLCAFAASVVWLGCRVRTRPRVMTSIGFYGECVSA